MADPWAEFVTSPAPSTAPAKNDPWADFAQPETKKKQQPYTGTLLPLSRDESGLHFAVPKVLQSVIGAATLPGDAYQGKVDPFSDEGIARANDLAGLVTPVSPATRAGAGWAGVPLAKVEEPVPPTAEALRAAANEQYAQARGMDARYQAQAVSDWARQQRAELERQGFRDHRAPETFAFLDELSNPPAGGYASLDDLHSAHEAFSSVANSPNLTKPRDPAAAGVVDRSLRQFITEPDPASVVAGTPTAEAAAIYKEAGGNYGAAKRAELLGNRERYADIGAAAANSGRNYDNAARQRVRDLLKPEVLDQGRNLLGSFNDQEIASLEAFVRGDMKRNTARNIANVLGGGGGLGQHAVAGVGGAAGGAIGALAGGPVGAAAGSVLGYGAGLVPGVVAKGVENRMAQSAMDELELALRKRSPMYERMLANAPVRPAPNAEARSAMVRYLLELEAADKARKSAQMQAPEA